MSAAAIEIYVQTGQPKLFPCISGYNSKPVILLFGAFMDILDTMIINIAIPSIQIGLQASSSAVEWTANAYILGMALIVITGGRLGDILGRKKMFMLGIPPLNYRNFIIICEHASPSMFRRPWELNVWQPVLGAVLPNLLNRFQKSINYDLMSLTPKSNAFRKSPADIFSTRLDFSSSSGIR
ncbi:MAG: MFS transporter [Ruminiclostridium sp.]